jgi:hypothetical protein
MAYAVRVVEPNLVLSRLFDPFRPGDIVDLLKEILAVRRPLRGFKVFCDVTEASPGELSFNDMKAVNDFVRSQLDDFAGMRWATFAEGLLNFGFARMAGELASGLPYEYRAFRDRELAYNWLSVTPAMVSHLERRPAPGPDAGASSQNAVAYPPPATAS